MGCMCKLPGQVGAEHAAVVSAERHGVLALQEAAEVVPLVAPHALRPHVARQAQLQRDALALHPNSALCISSCTGAKRHVVSTFYSSKGCKAASVWHHEAGTAVAAACRNVMLPPCPAASPTEPM